MTETLKRRVLFFSLPLLAASAAHAILIALMEHRMAGLLAGIISAVAAFVVGFRYLDDRDCVILNDEIFKPAMGFGVALLLGLVLGAGMDLFGSMAGALLTAFAGFAGAGCVASYVNAKEEVEPKEGLALLAAAVGQIGILTWVMACRDATVPTAMLGLTMCLVMSIRFWRIGAPESEMSS